jgi:hypothetical protein
MSLCLKSFKSPAVTQQLLHHLTSTSPHLLNLIVYSPLNMIFSTVVVVSILSLLSSARAATIHARRDGCTFVCPDKDLDDNALYSSATDDADIYCSYIGESFNLCKYNSVSRIPFSRRQPRLTL